MKILHLLAVCCVMAVLSACNKQAVVNYTIKNIASDSIMAVRSYPNSVSSDTFYISYNQTVTIGSSSPGNEHVSKYQETGSRLSKLSTVKVYKNNQESRIDYMQSSYWNYIEKGSKRADYLATVTDNDF